MLLLFTTLLACQESKTSDPTSEDVVDIDEDGDGYLNNEDCDDDNALINPQAEEICDGVDNNCNGTIDEDVQQIFYIDTDADGFGDPNSVMLACELPAGYSQNGSDCDDDEARAYPGADEECDEIDNDCNGLIDDEVGDWYYLDLDGDGYGDDNQPVRLCTLDDSATLLAGDCNDRNESVHPDAPDYCDGLDNDCNEIVDDGESFTFYADSDSDGYGDPLTSIEACAPPEDYVPNAFDCNDLDTNIHPLAEEICNEIDDNCNITVDEGVQTTFYFDADLDGYGNASNTILACTMPAGYLLDDQDCDDADNDIHPAAIEICNGDDENCNNVVDEGVQSTFYLDFDGDGVGDTAQPVQACDAPANHVLTNGDCDDNDDNRYPGADELCDEIDNNCNSVVDEGAIDETVFYLDLDEDGYGVDSTSVFACSAPTGFADALGDCDDQNDTIYPGADEGCDGTDYNCDGLIDNDLDEDGLSDQSCGGTDCDDTDPSLPNTNGVCAAGLSCRDILDSGLSSGDGIYEIDPDGSGGEDPFSVYCDMSADGGGWTLAMRFDSAGSTFTFNSPYWTDDITLNESNPDPEGSDAKYASFFSIEGSAIRGCLKSTTSEGCKSYPLPQSTTLLDLFVDTPIGSDSSGNGGLFFYETDNERLNWLSYAGFSMANTTVGSALYIRTGINIDDDLSCYDARVRFGLALNNQSSVYTLNDAVGFGASAYYSADCEYAIDEDAPWSVGAGMAAGPNLYDIGGTIWIY